MSKQLDGKIALVTGGGRGLGRAFAEALAQAGSLVAITGRSEDKLAETVKLIESAGGRALAIAGDVSNPQSVEQAVTVAEQQLGPMDILVNNAGITGQVKEDWLTDPDEWWHVLETNLHGSYMFARRVLPGMVERGKGRIINISSGGAQAPVPYLGSYAVSKAAITQYSNILGRQLEGTGVTVFAFAPSFVRTEMTEWVSSSPDIHSASQKMFSEKFEEGTDTSLETCVNMFMFLASGRGDALTGRHIGDLEDESVLLRRVDEIQRDDLYTLRLRT